MSSLRPYLEQMTAGMRQLGLRPGEKYVSLEDYVAQNGRGFSSEALTSEELQIVTAAVKNFGLRRTQPRQCFYNAQMIVTSDFTGTLRYCEGYASGNACFPVLHGWITINGKLVDVTWRLDGKPTSGALKERVLGVIPEGWEYIGVEFRTSYVYDKMLRTHEAGSLLDDWRGGHPLLIDENTEKILVPVTVTPA